MAYEYAKESREVAKQIVSIVNLLSDEKDDQQQIGQAIAAAASIYAQMSSVMSVEDKQVFRAKFAAKVGLLVAGMLIDKYIVDEV